MSGLFQNITTIAFEEILDKHLKPSKFGYFITENQKENLLQDLVEFLETARNLKSRGDKILATETIENKTPSKKQPRNQISKRFD